MFSVFSITVLSYHLFNGKQKYRYNKIRLSNFGQNLGFRSPARPDINLNFLKNPGPDKRDEQHSYYTHNMGNKGNSSDKIVPHIEANIQLFYVGM